MEMYDYEVKEQHMVYLYAKLRARADKRVKRGMKVLDKKFGRSWPLRIQVEYLDLASAEHCVLGQLGPDLVAHLTGQERSESDHYGEAAFALFGEAQDRQAMQCGFIKDELTPWRILNDAWEHAVRERQQPVGYVF